MLKIDVVCRLGCRHKRRSLSALWLLLFLAAAATACAPTDVASEGASSDARISATTTEAQTDEQAAAEPPDADATDQIARTSDESPLPPVDDEIESAKDAPIVQETSSAESSDVEVADETDSASEVRPVAVELPPAPIGFEDLTSSISGAQPISINIDAIDVEGAPVVAVGVNEDLTFEVPPADEVGWYEFGPIPGAEGSSVLAAHIAYNGVDGVFRYLSEVPIGTIVTIGFDDGSSQRYLIEEVTEYFKEDLPDSLFSSTGDPQLVLITCGGAFNEQIASYDSNTVVVATPL